MRCKDSQGEEGPAGTHKCCSDAEFPTSFAPPPPLASHAGNASPPRPPAPSPPPTLASSPPRPRTTGWLSGCWRWRTRLRRRQVTPAAAAALGTPLLLDRGGLEGVAMPASACPNCLPLPCSPPPLLLHLIMIGKPLSPPLSTPQTMPLIRLALAAGPGVPHPPRPHPHSRHRRPLRAARRVAAGGCGCGCKGEGGWCAAGGHGGWSVADGWTSDPQPRYLNALLTAFSFL